MLQQNTAQNKASPTFGKKSALKNTRKVMRERIDKPAVSCRILPTCRPFAFLGPEEKGEELKS